MYFMNDDSELIGKTIVFTHMAEFAEAITVVTEDKGILVVQQSLDESRIKVYPAKRAQYYIWRNKYLREQLHELGIISEEEFAEQRKKEEEARREREQAWKEQQEERDWEKYQELHERFKHRLEK